MGRAKALPIVIQHYTLVAIADSKLMPTSRHRRVKKLRRRRLVEKYKAKAIFSRISGMRST